MLEQWSYKAFKYGSILRTTKDTRQNDSIRRIPGKSGISDHDGTALLAKGTCHGSHLRGYVNLRHEIHSFFKSINLPRLAPHDVTLDFIHLFGLRAIRSRLAAAHQYILRKRHVQWPMGNLFLHDPAGLADLGGVCKR